MAEKDYGDAHWKRIAEALASELQRIMDVVGDEDAEIIHALLIKFGMEK